MQGPRRPARTAAATAGESDEKDARALQRTKRFGHERGRRRPKTVLECRSVSESNEADYRERFAKITKWARAQSLLLRGLSGLDNAATLWLDKKFFDGDPSAEGSKDLAAMGYVSPLLTRGAPELTRAHDACRGWRNWPRRRPGSPCLGD